ncbi:MAG TPA: fibronectin type III domain-containing protein [Longimicrobium sp.]|nr:fibronectin type III domain-containing protein [Longimicrobium sp.]
MTVPSASRSALALFALLAAGSCDRAVVAPSPAPGEVKLATGASLPAVPGFTAQANIQSFNPPRVWLSWQDVAGEDSYLIQWRPGSSSTWRTLVTTGANRTGFGTDSARIGEYNHYRIAAMTSSFQAGPFTTLLMTPSVVATGVDRVADSVTRITIGFRNFGPQATYWVEYGTDPGLSGAVQTPAITPAQYWAPATFDIPVQPGVRYYYRAVGTAETGTGLDSIRTFVAGVAEAPGVQASFHQAAVGTRGLSSFRPPYRVQLEWTQPGTQAQTYRIQRRTAGQAGWVTVAERAGGYRAFLDVTFAVTQPLQLEYRVLACVGDGQCAASEPVQVATMAVPEPANFRASIPSVGQALLQWDDMADEDAYIVQYRADSAASWTTLVTTGQSRTSLTNHIPGGTTHHYRIAALVYGRRGNWAVDSVTAPPRLTVATDPATLPSSTSATLNGRVNSGGGPATVWFEWGTSPTLASFSPTPAATVGEGVHSAAATLTELAPGTYYFRVAATAGALGPVRGAIRTVEIGLASAPILYATFEPARYYVFLSWTYSGETTPALFRIYRNSTLVREVSANTRSWTDVNVPAGAGAVNHSYRVDACPATGRCTPSTVETVSATPMGAPSGFAATLLADGRVRLQWQDLPGSQEYLVQWRTSGSSTWQLLLTTGANVTAYTTSRVTAGTTNEYRVAGLAGGLGPFTATTIAVP